jgi:hypothetical protein
MRLRNCILGIALTASVASPARGADDVETMAGGMMGGMMGGSMEEMSTIHSLLSNHQRIRRSVEDIPGGVRTITTSDDPQVAALIRQHVREMKHRIEQGRPIRQMDPLFREIFANHEHIHIDIADVPGGVSVIESADSPRATLLVRQHARRAVSEFVAEGMSRAMRPTPLPPGYAPAESQERSGGQRGGCGCRMSST